MSDEKIATSTPTKPGSMGRSITTEAQRIDGWTSASIEKLRYDITETLREEGIRNRGARRESDWAQLSALRGIRSALWALVAIAAASAVSFVTLVASVIW